MTKKNYEQLVNLSQKLKSRPFEILAFPCNQFGGQEPGAPQEIREFANRHGVTFMMMEKIDVNGDDTHPVYALLKGEGANILWNFSSKFIIDCDSEKCQIRRYDGAPNPSTLEGDIVELLDAAGSEKDS